MPSERVLSSAVLRRFRVDAHQSADELLPRAGSRTVLLVALAAGFVLLGVAGLEPGPVESRLGLAAGAGLGPVGQVFGRWEPALMPGQVGPSWLWAWGEALTKGGLPSGTSVRWPAALAGILIGCLLARRLNETLGPRAGILAGLCWFGSLALMDRSAGAGLDLMTALGVVAALDRVLSRGADALAGTWAGLGFLAGGWPALVAVVLPMLVVGRRGAYLSVRFLVPPLAIMAAWSAWTLTVAPVQVWAEAIALPLTRPSALGLPLWVGWGPGGRGLMALPTPPTSWALPFWVVIFGLPWSPFAALAAWRGVREGWSAPGRSLVIGWLQVAGACVLAGSLVPGLALATRIPALAGVALTAAAVLDRTWAGAIGTGPRRGTLGLAGGIVLGWAVLTVPLGIYIAAAWPYYRPVAIVLVGLGLATACAGLDAASRGRVRSTLGAVLVVAIGLKIAHAWVYVPEWNYRCGQGPWGRAIAQWVPPTWPIYTIHPWPADLAFATARPIRQLADARHLNYVDLSRPAFVLLHPAEFEHWPKDAPPLVQVRAFEDARGVTSRVLARTAGDLAKVRQDEAAVQPPGRVTDWLTLAEGLGNQP